MRISGITTMWCAFACFAATMAVAPEARATYGNNPYELDLFWPDGTSSGTLSASCDDGNNCVQGDEVVLTTTGISTDGTRVSLDIDWASSVINSDDVPWCLLQITCHDGGDAQHIISDVQNWGSCSAANAFGQNPPGTDCDVADEIMIMVGINRGGFT